MSDIAARRGVLLGLAAGDALGRPVEFLSPSQISSKYGQVTEMLGHGVWNKPPGTVTDDTELALRIAESIVSREGFDPPDVADRFVDWFESGPFDVGNMTQRALILIEKGRPWDEAGAEVWRSSPEGSNAGNGSVMRAPPLAVAFANDTERLMETSILSSVITHADPRCTYGTTLLNLTIAGILSDEKAPLQTAIVDVQDDAPDELVESLDVVASGETPGQLATSGYVVDTLQTALHDALLADSFEQALVTAVNRGGDTDTIGAVTGAVAGARFGASAIPQRWVAEIDDRERLSKLADRLGEIDLS